MVLGLNWDVVFDDFVFYFEIIYGTVEKLDGTNSTRNFFYPLGLISIIKLQPMLIFSELCRSKFEWAKIINDRVIIK